MSTQLKSTEMIALTWKLRPIYNTFICNVDSTFAHNKLCNKKEKNKPKCLPTTTSYSCRYYIAYSCAVYIKMKWKKTRLVSQVLDCTSTQLKSPCLIQKDNPHIYFIGFVKYMLPYVFLLPFVRRFSNAEMNWIEHCAMVAQHNGWCSVMQRLLNVVILYWIERRRTKKIAGKMVSSICCIYVWDRGARADAFYFVILSVVYITCSSVVNILLIWGWGTYFRTNCNCNGERVF